MKRCRDCSHLFDGRGWTCPSCGAAPCVIDGFPAFAPAAARENEGYDPRFHAELAELEAAHFWFRARNELILWALARFFPAPASFLEVGCGTGYVLSGVAARFPRAALTGSEILSSGLPFAARRAPLAELIQMDARDIPYVEHFDVAGAFDVLEHIEDDEAALAALRGALRPAGGLIVTVPQHRWMWSGEDVVARHARRYEADELRSKVARAGFSVLFETSFVSLLLPLMWLSRVGRDRVDASDPLSGLRIGGGANRLLLSVMRSEAALIRAGARFPFGGSRLLVARKV